MLLNNLSNGYKGKREFSWVLAKDTACDLVTDLQQEMWEEY